MRSSIKNKAIWLIAYPIIFGNLAQTLIALTDTAFLGRVSSIALGASMMAGIYYYVYSTWPGGFGHRGYKSLLPGAWEKDVWNESESFSNMALFLYWRYQPSFSCYNTCLQQIFWKRSYSRRIFMRQQWNTWTTDITVLFLSALTSFSGHCTSACPTPRSLVSPQL